MIRFPGNRTVSSVVEMAYVRTSLVEHFRFSDVDSAFRQVFGFSRPYGMLIIYEGLEFSRSWLGYSLLLVITEVCLGGYILTSDLIVHKCLLMTAVLKTSCALLLGCVVLCWLRGLLGSPQLHKIRSKLVRAQANLNNLGLRQQYDNTSTVCCQYFTAIFIFSLTLLSHSMISSEVRPISSLYAVCLLSTDSVVLQFDSVLFYVGVQLEAMKEPDKCSYYPDIYKDLAAASATANTLYGPQLTSIIAVDFIHILTTSYLSTNARDIGVTKIVGLEDNVITSRVMSLMLLFYAYQMWHIVFSCRRTCRKARINLFLIQKGFSLKRVLWLSISGSYY